ncbi:MAG: peptide-methionine (S)-S-oxide reductase, partial [Gemmatimonadetes bacterium]|nr:peptide-methionine (S)-S-oxide reductase [Gemmatimonadota bacterium]
MRTAIYAFLILLLIGGALALSRVRGADGVEPRTDAGPIGQEPAVQGAAVATFAGGCFWCVEE